MEALLKAKLAPKYFIGEEAKAWDFVVDHVNANQVLPHIETLTKAFPDLPHAVEPVSYYVAKVEERYAYRTLNMALTECSDLMADKQLEKVRTLMQDAVAEVFQSSIRHEMLEFASEGIPALQVATHEAKKVFMGAPGAKQGILMGFPSLDENTMGLFGGDVLSVIGRPAAGKSYFTLYAAHDAWFKQKRNVMVVSMEMGIEPLVFRTGALHTGLSITHLKQGGMGSEKKIEQTGVALKDHPSKLWIIDGNLTATVDDIYGLAAFLKPDIVFIDGAYLLRHTNPRVDRWTRVAENIEAIKKRTAALGIPTVCSYQFNRDAAKKKSNADVGVEDIGYSDAIGQISSIILGMFEEDGPGTTKKREIRVLKGREGTTGAFKIKWDFLNMDFSELNDDQLIGEIKPEYT
jgi:replicative DNA helicase